MMFGYAVNETDVLMPLPIHLAHRLAERLAEVRKSGVLPYLRPDGKTQVTVEYEGNRPVRLSTVLISTQHQPGIDADTLIKPDLIEHVINPLLPSDIDTSDVRVLVNPTGTFVLGGPHADCGLTGRKIIVDTYGGAARHGGGAFSGKDPSKVDRSAAYAARWVAKNVVAAGAADRCEVQVAYAIGVAQPVSILVETFGTETVDPAKISEAVQEVFDLRPAAIIRDLELRRPIYAKTAAYGHFGREDKDLTWEHTTRRGRPQVRVGSVIDAAPQGAPLVVRVLPDVPAIDKTFDYLVPDGVRDQVRVGDVVRVELHGRRVGGWIVETGVEPPPGRGAPTAGQAQRPGPDAGAHRAGRVGGLALGRPAGVLPEDGLARPGRPGPAARARCPAASPSARMPRLRTALDEPLSILRLPPGGGPRRGGAGRRRQGQRAGARARRWPRRRGSRRGSSGPAWRSPSTRATGRPAQRARTVVGTRAAAWAPVGDLAAVVVLDEHDEAHQQEQAPTWHARDVAIERARRAGVPCVLISPCPSLEALAWRASDVPDRPARAGRVAGGRGRRPPRGGPAARRPLLTRASCALLRSDQRVLCVLNRTGRARLLACADVWRRWRRCEACGAAVEQPEDVLHCRRCGTERPAVCLDCGSTRFKNARAGVTRVREELEALVGEPVVEITATSDAARPGRAGWWSAPKRCSSESTGPSRGLPRPRPGAAGPALPRGGAGASRCVARAARVRLGRDGPATARRAGCSSRRGCRSTRSCGRPCSATRSGSPSAERERRELLRLPPFAALAEVSGAAAPDFVAALGAPVGVQVAETSPGRWLVRAGDHADPLRRAGRRASPAGRLRVEVDPLRV